MSSTYLKFLIGSLFSQNWFLLFLIAAFFFIGLTPFLDMQQDVYVSILTHAETLFVLLGGIYIVSQYDGAKDIIFWVSKPMSIGNYVATQILAATFFIGFLVVLNFSAATVFDSPVHLNDMALLFLNLLVVMSFGFVVDTYCKGPALTILASLVLFEFMFLKNNIIDYLRESSLVGLEFLGYILLSISFIVPDYHGNFMLFFGHSIAFIAFAYLTVFHKLLSKTL